MLGYFYPHNPSASVFNTSVIPSNRSSGWQHNAADTADVITAQKEAERRSSLRLNHTANAILPSLKTAIKTISQYEECSDAAGKAAKTASGRFVDQALYESYRKNGKRKEKSKKEQEHSIKALVQAFNTLDPDNQHVLVLGQILANEFDKRGFAVKLHNSFYTKMLRKFRKEIVEYGWGVAEAVDREEEYKPQTTTITQAPEETHVDVAALVKQRSAIARDSLEKYTAQDFDKLRQDVANGVAKERLMASVKLTVKMVTGFKRNDQNNKSIFEPYTAGIQQQLVGILCEKILTKKDEILKSVKATGDKQEEIAVASDINTAIGYFNEALIEKGFYGLNKPAPEIAPITAETHWTEKDRGQIMDKLFQKLCKEYHFKIQLDTQNSNAESLTTQAYLSKAADTVRAILSDFAKKSNENFDLASRCLSSARGLVVVHPENSQDLILKTFGTKGSEFPDLLARDATQEIYLKIPSNPNQNLIRGMSEKFGALCEFFMSKDFKEQKSKEPTEFEKKYGILRFDTNAAQSVEAQKKSGRIL